MLLTFMSSQFQSECLCCKAESSSGDAAAGRHVLGGLFWAGVV